MPSSDPVDVRIGTASCSITSTYSKGDKGHLCLVPFAIYTGEESTPLIITLADGLWYKAIIYPKSEGLTPI